MTGALPPTDAPKSREPYDSRASAASSLPSDAMSSLFAVTNFLPRRSDSRAIVPAVSRPPIASTTTSTSSSTNEAQLLVNRVGEIARPRSRFTSRTRIRESSTRTPWRDAMVSAQSSRSLTSDPPTTPQPARPTRIVRSEGGSGAGWGKYSASRMRSIIAAVIGVSEEMTPAKAERPRRCRGRSSLFSSFFYVAAIRGQMTTGYSVVRDRYFAIWPESTTGHSIFSAGTSGETSETGEEPAHIP